MSAIHSTHAQVGFEATMYQWICAMPCQPEVADSTPGFSRTTSGWAFKCASYTGGREYTTINPPGLVLATAQEKSKKSYEPLF